MFAGDSASLAGDLPPSSSSVFVTYPTSKTVNSWRLTVSDLLIADAVAFKIVFKHNLVDFFDRFLFKLILADINTHNDFVAFKT